MLEKSNYFGKFKIVLIAVIVSFCIFNFSIAQAQILDQNGREISRPTILPSSPFYFLKDIGREIQTLFTFDPVKRAGLRLDFSNQKLIELQKLINADSNKISESLSNYEIATETMRESASSLGKDNFQNIELLNQLVEQIFIHQQILAQFDNFINNQRLESVKNKSLENFTVSIFSIAQPKIIVQKIETNINDNLALKDFKMQILNNMYFNSPIDYKNNILQIQNDLLNQ
ncbi:MAG: DUF5667 domain-containing protein [Candidatus Paceibacterota bacterium]|jgi:hypothetical protein